MKAALLSVGAIVAIWSAAAGFSEKSRQSVAGHQFDVPKNHVFDAKIPWLPAPESDSFVFLLEPNRYPNQIPKHRILVQPLAGRCPGGVSHLMDVVCGKATELTGTNPKFERRQNELGSWSSDLFIVYHDDRTGQKTWQQVASCQLFEPNPANPKPSNLCTTVWGYKGMLLQFSFDETEADEMPRMKAKAMAFLDSWEIQ
ncbi:hypothetical protein [Novosphingobium sp. JCM 18896]|uniref:hypothetical protein n=1 Tax=Novosphingobium sp. JCM 18896 TaxID=2989731 RepID=UPI002221FE70|nr:hypothetical protein [Novosphingobium sp. JCM 18896]MCW1431580.1 hypothetical protein [Novosphingobium sp. JCM 18896]